MPVSADRERQLLNKYKLTTLYPDTWPHEGNDSSEDDDVVEQPNGAAAARHTSKLSVNSRSSLSRYRNIDRHASIRSGTTDSESLVQKDEPDPLGKAPSVAMELKKRGVPVEDNLKLRNRFMLSSTSFSPALFLSQVHQDASTEDLLRGLDHLSQSIEQKSASLKVLVESNFEKFVKAKATIDNVYKEMRDQGAEADTQQQATARRTSHSRHASRGQTHFRNTSGAFSLNNKPLPSDKKKNALTKESEYGVQGIKAPLVEAAIKAEEVWGPALGGREKEEALKSVLSTMDQYRDIFRLSGNMRESARKNDYDNIVDAYKQAKKYADQARNIAEVAKGNDAQLGDSDAQQIIVTAKMWHDVSKQIEDFKREVWKKLKSSHGRKLAAVADESEHEEHMELIGILLQLGVDENPIWEWLHSRYAYLKDKIARSFERSRIELEIMRRKIGNNENTDVRALAKHLRSVETTGAFRLNKDTTKDIDTPAVLAFWEKVQGSVSALLSSQTGILGEVLEYWETAQSFIDNKAQKSFPTAVFAAGLEHLELEPDDVQNLRSGAVDLVNVIRESIFSFFSDPPVEDISELYSPIPPTPITPATDSASANALTPSGKRAFTFDRSTVPPPSPKRGESWEKFAFWPPQANSLSGSLYLSRILVLVGTAASEMASMPVVKQARVAESLKTLVGAVRERCVQAVCAAWNTDAERCKVLETWTRSPDRKDLTVMPSSFAAFEEKILQNTQKIAYITDATNTKGSAEVVVSPPAKLLQALRSCFVTSLYKALSGMVENAENTKNDSTNDADPDGVTVAKSGAVDGDSVTIAVDANNRNIRMLLTLSNLAHLRADIIPHLISQFESSFSVKLTDESKTIRDVLGQIDARLFQSYAKPTVDKLSQIVNDGITSPGWVPSTPRPTDAKPYVYDVLLLLVLVHSEITATASTLTNQILSYLLEQSSTALINAFKQRTKYTLPALMQATLDVEFMAQTLNNYTTDRAGEVQSQIYLALDERTDNDARMRLQQELPEMRSILKKLREGTKGEFGCFKRDRRGRTERAGSSRG
ncbi:Exocyst complex component S5 [Vermiconidia calcicola]|uniref:Exocyst complex component S5 n=1 Tax=Vermiconidia calcicola TaxID=1690605 RepID=A0ACC3NDP5_9PEZI|nr:Exocyst complex component S5 [Vermiconidia calcicola]